MPRRAVHGPEPDLLLQDQPSQEHDLLLDHRQDGDVAFDALLCRLVTFFHITMQDDLGLQYLAYFIGTGAILALLPSLEASRSRKSPLLAFPLLWLLASQVITLGAMLTVYALVFILSGAHRKGTKEQQKITRAPAESLIFSLRIGAVVPSL